MVGTMEKVYDIEIREEYAAKEFVFGFPFSNAISLVCCVEADYLQDALDVLADHLVEEDIFHHFWTDYYGVQEECEIGQTVDDFVESRNMICVGNTGIYMECPTLVSEKNK